MAIIDVKPLGGKPKAKKPAERFVSFRANPDGDYDPIAGTMTIAVGTEATDYVVTEFPTGWIGRGFTLFKVGADPKDYSVFVCQRGAEGDSCDCADAIYRGRACKHLGAVRKLIERGVL